MGQHGLPLGHGDGPRMMEPNRPGFLGHGHGPDSHNFPHPGGPDIRPGHRPMDREGPMFMQDRPPISQPGDGPMPGRPGAVMHGSVPGQGDGKETFDLHGPPVSEQGQKLPFLPVRDQGNRLVVDQGPADSSQPPSSDQGPAPAEQAAPSSSEDSSQSSDSSAVLGTQSVKDLFNRLLQFGIIKVRQEEEGTTSRADTPTLMQQEMDSIEEIPEIKLVPIELRKFHSGVVQFVYAGKQCSSCGVRFRGDCSDIYQDHLDWHFRMNRKEKDSKRATHRQWYFSESDWLAYEEIADLDERSKSTLFEMEVHGEPEPEIVGDGSCPADTNIPNDAFCEICCEQFEQFWNEAEEEWHYKEAIRVDGKTFHELCYQDAKENNREVGDVEEESDALSRSESELDLPSESNEEVKIKEEPMEEPMEEESGQDVQSKQVESSVSTSDLSTSKNDDDHDDVVKDENKETKQEITSSDDVQIKVEKDVDETDSKS